MNMMKALILAGISCLFPFLSLQAEVLEPRLAEDTLGWIGYNVTHHPWQNKEMDFRIPIMFDNRNGPSQLLYPVEVPVQIPKGLTDPSVDVRDEAGALIPSFLEKGKVVFLASSPKEAWRSYYIYFGRRGNTSLSSKPILTDNKADANTGWLIDNGRIVAKFGRRGGWYDSLLDYLGTKDMNFLNMYQSRRTLVLQRYFRDHWHFLVFFNVTPIVRNCRSIRLR